MLTGVQRGPVARGGHVEAAPAKFQVPRKRGDEWGALSERVSSGQRWDQWLRRAGGEVCL